MNSFHLSIMESGNFTQKVSMVERSGLSLIFRKQLRIFNARVAVPVYPINTHSDKLWRTYLHYHTVNLKLFVWMRVLLVVL